MVGLARSPAWSGGGPSSEDTGGSAPQEPLDQRHIDRCAAPPRHPRTGRGDACLTAATSIGGLTDTLTTCLTQGRGKYFTGPLTAADTHVWTPTSRQRLLSPADILLTLTLERHQ